MTITTRPLINGSELFWSQGLNGTGQIIGCGDTGLTLRKQGNDSPETACGVDPARVVSYDVSDGGDRTGTPHGDAVVSLLLAQAPAGTGLAFGSKLAFVDLGRGPTTQNYSPSPLDPTLYTTLWNRGARVMTFSSGRSSLCESTLGCGHYGVDAMRLDHFLWTHPEALVVYSVGNDGLGHVGSPATASNVLSVGSVRSDGTVSDWSSRGTLPNGWGKPDVYFAGESVPAMIGCTPGRQSGTSFAAPGVAAVAALAREDGGRRGLHPTGALLKALLVHTATPNPPHAPVVSLARTAQVWDDHLLLNATIDRLPHSFEIRCPGTTDPSQLPLTLVWTDVPGHVNAQAVTTTLELAAFRTTSAGRETLLVLNRNRNLGESPPSNTLQTELGLGSRSQALRPSSEVNLTGGTHHITITVVPRLSNLVSFWWFAVPYALVVGDGDRPPCVLHHRDTPTTTPLRHGVLLLTVLLGLVVLTGFCRPATGNPHPRFRFRFGLASPAGLPFSKSCYGGVGISRTQEDLLECVVATLLFAIIFFLHTPPPYYCLGGLVSLGYSAVVVWSGRPRAELRAGLLVAVCAYWYLRTIYFLSWSYGSSVGVVLTSAALATGVLWPTPAVPP